jgi:energy-converting hydrogenase Eha subunit C
MFAALALIAIGSLLLLSNLGYIKIANLAGLIHTWWPLILILVGVSMFITRWRRSR